MSARSTMKIKPELRPRRTGPDQDQISIGGNIFGVARMIEDPSGVVWETLSLLDGKRPSGEVAHMVASRRSLGVDEVLGLIDQIHGVGVIEPVHEPEGLSLPSDLVEYHTGTAALMAWMDVRGRQSRWELTSRLRSARVLVVGVGGTGSHAALGLAAAGVGHLTLVDSDVVARDNLGRQTLYRPHDVGRPKVTAAAEALAERFAFLSVDTLMARMAGPNDFGELLRGGFDCLVLGADEPQVVRRWANQACLASGTAWAAGGYQGPQTSTWVFRPGTGPCLGCLELQQATTVAGLGERIDLDHWTPPSVNAVSYVTAAVSGAHLANASLALLVGVPDIEVNCQYFTSLVRPDHSFVLGLGEDSPRCEHCGVDR